MTPREFRYLKPGDLIRQKGGGSAMIVHSNFGGRVTAARIVDMTNPDEWDRVTPCGAVKAATEA